MNYAVKKNTKKSEVIKKAKAFVKERGINLGEEYTIQEAAHLIKEDYKENFKNAYVALYYKINQAKLVHKNLEIDGANTTISGLDFVLSYIRAKLNKDKLKETKEEMLEKIKSKKNN